MRTTLIGTALAVLFLTAGCKDHTPPDPADPGKARESLQTALETWQKGEKPSALGKLQPPLLFADEDWKDGSRLQRFQIGDKPIEWGPTLRFKVAITVQDARGVTAVKNVVYAVATNPRVSIAREDR